MRRLVLGGTALSACLALLVGGALADGGARPPSPAAVPVAAHLDDAPTGVDVRRQVSTQTLVNRSGVAGTAARLSTSGGAPALVTALSVPAGTAVLGNLGTHASPSCTGTDDGNRVQVVYAREPSTASRYAALLPSLRSFVADVDDTFALSSPTSGRRVRWVQDAACIPAVPEVVVPDGTLTGNRGVRDLATSLAAAGYDRPDRKYLVFADAASLCGIGQMLLDDSAAASNANNGGIETYARVDTPCWAAGDGEHSTPAHELMHMLGGVQPSAPNATSFGHCTDESDAMCYADGPGASITSTCTAPGAESLFDCNRNDYFDSGPTPGPLARAWNTATSSFLDVVPALGATATSAPPTTTAATTTTTTTVPTTTVPTPITTTTVPTTATPVTGTTIRPGPARVSVTLARSTRLFVGIAGRVSATVRSAGRPVATRVTLQTYTRAKGWRSVANTTSSASGLASFTVRSNTAARLPMRALVPASSTVAAARSAASTLSVVRRPTSIRGTVRAGRPGVLIATMRTSSGAPVAGQYLTLQRRAAGTTAWRTVTRKRTNGSGQTAFAVAPRSSTAHRWVYFGAWNSAPSASSAITGTR